MESFDIRHEDGETGGRYVTVVDGHEAEMTYSKAGTSRIIIDHTGVPPEFEGRGIALQLVKASIADAREQGFKITQVCPYVVVQFRRHPEWRDLLA